MRPYYESSLLDTVISVFREIDLDLNKIKFYEPIINSCIDFIAKLCNNIPTKVPIMIENNAIPMILNILKQYIPQKPNVLNSIFGLIYAVHLHDEGKKVIKNHTKPIIETLFEFIFSEESVNTNIYSIKHFFNDGFYSPYTMFLRMEEETEILELFFYKILQKIKEFNENLDTIILKDHEKLHKILYDEKYSYKYSYVVSIITQFLINITQEEREILKRENVTNFEELILNYYNLLVHPIILYCLGTNVTISTSIIKSIFSNNPDKLSDHLINIIQQSLKVISIKSGTDLFQKANSITSYLSKTTQDMIVDHVFNDHHVDKMIGKMVFIVEVTLRKLFFFISKLNLGKLIIIMGTLMLFLVRRQSNINMYMSPVNGCILVINQKNHFKFLSEKLSPHVINYLIAEGIKNNSAINPLIFNESNYIRQDLHFDSCFDQNMRVEIIESSKVFTNEIFDFKCKNLINSHMPILDLMISIGKNNRKKLRELISGGDMLMSNWNSLAFGLILVILNLDTEKDNKFITDLDLENKDDMLKIINILIYYINILNNVNIIILDKSMSGYVLYQFYQYGGIKKFFEIIKMLLNLTEIITDKNIKLPILLLLLVKNMWNIIISFFMKLFKMNFETINLFSVIINLFGYNNAVEFSSHLKLTILKLFYKNILGNPNYSIRKISKLSYPFYTLILTIIDSCINQYKYHQTKTFPEEKTIKELINMGFSRISILIAMQEGINNRENIADFILSNNEMENNLKKFLKNKETDDIESYASQFFDLKDIEKVKLDFNTVNTKDMSKLCDKYIKLFNKIFKVLIDDELNSQKLQQVRKMNLIFRIKDILLMNNKVLPQFIREILIYERENQIEIEKKSILEGNLDVNENNLKSLLQSRMLINFVIVKDRSKAANIFESLNIDEIAKIFNDFNIIENNLRTIKLVLKLIEKRKESNTEYREIIYECLFMTYLSFHFASYYEKLKQQEKEEKLLKIEENEIQKFDLPKYKADYIELFREMIELQSKLNEIGNNNNNYFLDEQSLIIIFMSISENFDFNDNLKSFIEKNSLKFLFKLRKTVSYENVSDSKFKLKVVLDEAFRIFLFKMFEDSKSYENLLESIIKYIFANYYDSVQNDIENKKIEEELDENDDEDDEESKDERKNKEKKTKKEKEKKENDNIFEEQKISKFEGNNKFKKENDEKNDSGNYKSAETAATHNLNLEFNFNSFLKIMYPYITKNKEIFLKVLQKIAIIDKKISDTIQNVDKTFKKKKGAKDNKEEKTLLIRLLPEFSNEVINLYKEIKGTNETNQVENKNKDKQGDKSKEKFNELIGSKSKSQPFVSQSNEKGNKKNQIESQIEKIFKQFSSAKVKLMNQIMKHIWDVTFDLKEKIDSKLENKDTSPLKNEYMFPIDTMLISLSNLIHTYPSVLSVILKYHGVLPDQKKPLSFISFLLKEVFYVMNFYNTCDKNENKAHLIKDNKESKYFGFEPNTQLSIFEAFRSHNIISHLILSLTFKRRNMIPNEIFLISKLRRKILSELENDLINLSGMKTLDSKKLISFKIINYILYNFTFFHENSHIYTSTNCFELMKNLLSKEYSIIKNLIEVMKFIDIKDNLAFHIHKLASIYLSEMTKFLKMSNTNEELLKKPQKLTLNNIKYDSNSGSYIIEAIPQRNNNLLDEDMLFQEEEDEEDEEGLEMSDSLSEDEEEEEENSNEDFYYSLSNSENEEEEEEIEDLDEEDDVYDNEEEEDSERPDNNHGLENANIEINEEDKNEEDDDEMEDEDNSVEDDDYEDESEYDNIEQQFENMGENEDESNNLIICRCQSTIRI